MDTLPLDGHGLPMLTGADCWMRAAEDFASRPEQRRGSQAPQRRRKKNSEKGGRGKASYPPYPSRRLTGAA